MLNRSPLAPRARHALGLTALLSLLLSIPAAAQPIEAVPHAFEAGGVVVAAEMNANFEALVAEVRRLDGALTALQARVPAQLEARLAAAEGQLANATAQLAAQAAQIANLSEAVSAAEDALVVAQRERDAALAALGAANTRIDAAENARAAGDDALGARVGQVEGGLTAANDAQGALSARVDGLVEGAQELGRRLGIIDAGQRAQDGRLDALEDNVADLEERSDLAENVLTVDSSGAQGTFASVEAALGYLAARRIAPGRQVQIRVRPGVYVSQVPLIIDHPDSERLILRGEGADPTQVRLVFNGTDALTVSAGHRFEIENLTFDGEPTADGASRGRRGAVITDGAVLVVRAGVTFTRFSTGMQLDHGGTVRGSFGLRLVANAGAGLNATNGGTFNVPEAEISNNGAEGVTCGRRCYLGLNSATLVGNGISGVVAAMGSVIDMSNAQVDNHPSFGVSVESGTVLNLPNALVQRSGFSGLAAFSMSWANIRQARFIGNNTRNLGTQAQVITRPTAFLAISNGTVFEGPAPVTLPAVNTPISPRNLSLDNN